MTKLFEYFIRLWLEGNYGWNDAFITGLMTTKKGDMLGESDSGGSDGGVSSVTPLKKCLFEFLCQLFVYNFKH